MFVFLEAWSVGGGLYFLTNWNALNLILRFYTDVYVLEQGVPIQRITCLGQNIR